MADIRKLTSKSLNEIAMSNTFLYLLDISNNVESRVSLGTLLGNAVNTGNGISIYSGLVDNQNTFKSLLSGDSIVTLATTAAGELSIALTLANLDLSLCKNTTTPFLSTVDLTTNVGSTVLPVANGGTGASTLTDGGILLGSGTGAITAMAALAAGTIIQGDGTTDPTTLAIGTAGQMLAVNSGATALEYVAAPATSFVPLATSTLDMANNNIDLGSGSINKDGVGVYGLSINAANQIHIQPDGQSITGGSDALNISGGLFMQGTVNRSLTLGPPAAGNASSFTLNGSTATGSNEGGDILINPGASASGAGGDINIYSGASTSGSAGNVRLYARDGASTTFPILRVTNSKKVSIQNSTSDSTPVGLLDIKQTEGEGAMPVLRLEQTDADYAFSQFTGTTAADSTRNISSSTATSAAKTGAIKVLVQNGAETASVAWIRLWASAV